MKEGIKFYKNTKKYFWTKRKVGDDAFEKSHGYVTDYSRNFVLLYASDDFELDGFEVFQRNSITKLQYGVSERHYDKIMNGEGQLNKVGCNYRIDLTNWQSVFKSLKALNKNIIIENEDPNDKSFDIGEITKVTKAAVYLWYFDAQGNWNEEPTRIPYNLITLVRFDGKYVNTISKYLKKRK